jgi:hypothetical protein
VAPSERSQTSNFFFSAIQRNGDITGPRTVISDLVKQTNHPRSETLAPNPDDQCRLVRDGPPASDTHRPPGHVRATPRCTLIKAFLHPVGQGPPPLRLLVRRDRGHVLVIVLAGVCERGDEELERGVVVDGVVGDVVAGEGGEDGGPDGRMNGLVFRCALGFELYPSRFRS